MFRNHNSHRPQLKPVKIFFFLLFGAMALFIVGAIIQFLWNEILVVAVGCNPISFWQAVGLFVLARILFGRFRFGPGATKWRSHRRSKWRDKWIQMDDNEKAEMKEKWREWCKKKM